MTDDQKNAKQGSGVGEESTKKMSKGAKKRDRDNKKKKLSQIREHEEPASPSEGRTREGSEQGSVAEAEYDEQDDGASSQAMSERSAIDEDGPEQDTTRPQYANPTRASEAKRNEKIDLSFTMKKTLTLKEPPTSRPGTALRQQRSASVLGSRRPSPRRTGSAVVSGNKPDDAPSDRSAASSVTSNKRKGHRRDMRSRSLTAADVAYANQDVPFLSTTPNIPITVSSAPAPGTTTYEHEPFTIERWRQEDDGGEAVPLVQEEKPETPRSEKLDEQLAHLTQEEQELEPGLTAQSRDQRLEYMKTPVSKPEKHIESETQNSGVGDKGNNLPRPAGIEHMIFQLVVMEKDKLKDQLKAADTDKEALKTQLKAAEKKRDELEDHLSTAQVELQTCRDHRENLKRKHDKLQGEVKELQKQIAALEDREPRLQSSAAAAAENKRHRVAIQDLERKIAETGAELKTKEEDEKSRREETNQISGELSEANQTLKELRKDNDTLSGIIDKINQSGSIDSFQLGKVISSLATNSNASDLHTKVSTFIQLLVDTQQAQERQIADKKHSIVELKKAMVAWDQENHSFSSSLGSGLPSPGLVSSSSPRQADRDSFEKLFNDERRKRKAAEEKLAEVEANAKKTHSSLLQQQDSELQTELTSAQEELTTIRKKADELETLSKQWKGEVEEAKSELLERTRNFDKSIAQQQREVYTHVQEYHKKTQDSAHWEVQGLQKKLAAVEADLADTKKRFDQIKSDNEHREHHIKGLEQDQRVRIAHLNHVEQAHYRGEKLPSLPPVKSEPNDVARSPTSSSSTPWPPNPHSIPTPVIPACLLPAAIDRRKADLEKYKEDLKLVRGKEVLDFIVRAPSPSKFAHDGIMEKVRKWKLGNLYPPERHGWDAYEAKSAWERWQGAKWMEQSTISRRDEQALRKRGLWTAV
jgi:hypothetical protein